MLDRASEKVLHLRVNLLISFLWFRYEGCNLTNMNKGVFVNRTYKVSVVSNFFYFFFSLRNIPNPSGILGSLDGCSGKHQVKIFLTHFPEL